MQRIGQGLAQEHLASTFIQGKLQEHLQFLGLGSSSAIIVSTLPGESHELGALINAIFLCRRDLKTYLLPWS